MRFLFCNRVLLWQETLLWGLKRAGHEVLVPDTYEQSYLNTLCDTYEPDAMVCVGWVQDYVPPYVRAMRNAALRANIPIVYWATEDIQHLERWSLPLVKELGAKLVLTINESCVEEYEKRGHQAYYLNFAVNTDLFYPRPSDPRWASDVLLVANPYDFRGHFREKSLMDLLSGLVGEENLNLQVWGQGWDKVHRISPIRIPEHCLKGVAPYHLTPILYSSARIVLGPQNEDRFPTQVTMRTFEIMGTGSLLITSKTPAILRLFEPGKHLLTTDAPGETKELIYHHLYHDAARRSIAKSGLEKVIDHHTYIHRAHQLVDLMEEYLSQRGKPTSRGNPCSPPLPHCLMIKPESEGDEESSEIIPVGPDQQATMKFVLPSLGASSLRYVTLKLWQLRSTGWVDGVICSYGEAQITGEGPDPDGWWTWELPMPRSNSVELTLYLPRRSTGEVHFASCQWSGDEEYQPRIVMVYQGKGQCNEK